MEIRELAIAGAWEFTPVQHGDSRGVFLEAYQAPLLAEVIGHEFDLAQVNAELGRKLGLDPRVKNEKARTIHVFGRERTVFTPPPPDWRPTNCSGALSAGVEGCVRKIAVSSPFEL